MVRAVRYVLNKGRRLGTAAYIRLVSLAGIIYEITVRTWRAVLSDPSNNRKRERERDRMRV